MDGTGKKKRGPPPKPPGQKAEQLTIRLTPKLKYGLELLSRAQRGRSLSQVVEWAIQRGLNSVEVANETSLGKVLDTCWALNTEWERLLTLSKLAPELLDFDELNVLDAVSSNPELKAFVHKYKDQLSHATKGQDDVAKVINAQNDSYNASEAVSELMSLHWEEIKEAVARSDIDGLDTSSLPIDRLIPSLPKSALASVAALGKYLKGKGVNLEWDEPL